MKSSILDMLRQPEYTGENRCEPCTILNILLAGLFGSVLVKRSRILGYSVFVLAIGLIYLRGYFVPGTPTLTKQYLPAEVLRWFGKETEPETRSGFSGGSVASNSSQKGSLTDTSEDEPSQSSQDTDPHAFLLTAGVLEECEKQDDLCLVESFKTAWENEMSRVVEREFDASNVVSVLGVASETEEFEIEQYGDAWTLVSDSQSVGQWPSEGALVADVAGAHVLSEWSTQWDNLTPLQRGRVLNGLRLFIEQCPTGEGTVSMSQETVESCCSSQQVVTISCEETGDRLFEQPLPDA